MILQVKLVLYHFGDRFNLIEPVTKDYLSVLRDHIFIMANGVVQDKFYL